MFTNHEFFQRQLEISEVLDVQIIILKQTPTKNLIERMTTTQKYRDAILDILFKREDAPAMEFQKITVNNWFQKIIQGKEPFEPEKFSFYKQIVTTSITKKDFYADKAQLVQSIQILRYLNGVDKNTIKMDIDEFISLIKETNDTEVNASLFIENFKPNEKKPTLESAQIILKNTIHSNDNTAEISKFEQILGNNKIKNNSTFKYVEQLAFTLRSEEITDAFIINLMRSNTGDNFHTELDKYSAIKQLCFQLTQPQLSTLFEHYLEIIENLKNPDNFFIYQHLPFLSKRLGSPSQASIIKLIDLLNSENNVALNTSSAIYLQLLEDKLHLIPETFVLNLIKKFLNNDYVWQDRALLPRIMYLISKENITHVFTLLYSKVDITQKNKTHDKAYGLACECLCSLAPRLENQQIRELAKVLMDDEIKDCSLKVSVRKNLAKIAFLLTYEELTAFITKITQDIDDSICDYFKEIVHLLDETQKTIVLKFLLSEKMLHNKTGFKSINACLILANMLPVITQTIQKQEISSNLLKFINDGEEPCYALFVLIQMADELTRKQVEDILNLPGKTFLIILTKCILGMTITLKEESSPENSLSISCS